MFNIGISAILFYKIIKKGRYLFNMITLQTSNNSDKYDKLYKAANDFLNYLWAQKQDSETDIGKLGFNSTTGKLLSIYNGDPINVTEPESNIIYTLKSDSINELFGVTNDENYPGLDIENYDNSKAEATEFKIDTLGEYFNVIGTLGRIHPRFARLPIDEGTFDIDLDTRTISPPTGNKVYAVVGDHIAEVIYFSVPRYFDMVDLGSKEVSIIIQTSSIDDKGDAKEYLFEAQQRDLDTRPDHVIFGWPISQYITKTTNAITFAVRFYIGNITTSQDDALQYSLGTQPATIPVLRGLDFRGIGEPTALPPYLHNYDQTGTTTIEQPVFNDFTQPDSGALTQAVTFVPDIISDSTNRVYQWKYKNKGANAFVVLNNTNIDDYPDMVLNSTTDYTPIETEINKITEDQPTKAEYFNVHKENLAYKNEYGFMILVESEDNYDPDKDYYLIGTGSIPLELTTNRGGQYICDVTVRKGRMIANASSNIITISEAQDITKKDDLTFNTYYPTIYDGGYYKNSTDTLTPGNYINEQISTGELSFISSNNIINLNQISFADNTGVTSYSNVKVRHSLNNTIGETEPIDTLSFYKPIPVSSTISISSTQTDDTSNVSSVSNFYVLTDDNWKIDIVYSGSNIISETEGSAYRKRYYVLEKNNSPVQGYSITNKITDFNTIKTYIKQNSRNDPIQLQVIDIYESFQNEEVQSNTISIYYSLQS